MEAYPFSCINKRSSLNSLEITSTDGYDWSPFGKERRDELKMIENSIFYYQLKTNGYTHAWKEMYIKVNAQCNALGIPYKKRLSLYLKEIEYLSLLLHDTLPSNYSKTRHCTRGYKHIKSPYLFQPKGFYYCCMQKMV